MRVAAGIVADHCQSPSGLAATRRQVSRLVPWRGRASSIGTARSRPAVSRHVSVTGRQRANAASAEASRTIPSITRWGYLGRGRRGSPAVCPAVCLSGSRCLVPVWFQMSGSRCGEDFPFSGQVRPSAAAAGRRAGPVLAPLRAAGPAAAHTKRPDDPRMEVLRLPGPCCPIMVLACVRAGLLRSRSSSRAITTGQGHFVSLAGSRCA
jgi:hypothetical protein